MSPFSGSKALPRAQEPTSEGVSMFALGEYLFVLFHFCCVETGSLCISSWPGIHSTPVSVSQVLELQVQTTMSVRVYMSGLGYVWLKEWVTMRFGIYSWASC